MKMKNTCISVLTAVSVCCLFVFFSLLVNIRTSSAEGGDYTSGDTWKGASPGKGVYMMNCVPCHGDKGMGDGPLAYDFPEGAKPRNHTDANYMSTKSDKDLYKAVNEGGEAVGRSSGMPAFKGQLSDKEINDVIGFLRELCKCKYDSK